MTTQREQLEAEFPAEQLDQISKGGHRMTYVPVHEVIQRLNDVLGPHWSWKVTKIWRDERDPDWVLAYGDLTATIDGDTVTVSGAGGVKVSRTQTGQEIVDLGDEFKGADSDALKKAAQRIGVGLYLSRDADAIAYEAPAPTRSPLDEGWESVEQAKELIGELAERIKTLPDTHRAAVKLYTSQEIGVVWPPTRDEYARIVNYLVQVEDAQGLVWCRLNDCTSRRHWVKDHTEHLREVHHQDAEPTAKELQERYPVAEPDPDVVWASPELTDELGRYIDLVRNVPESWAAWCEYGKKLSLPATTAGFSETQAQAALDFLMALPSAAPAG